MLCYRTKFGYPIQIVLVIVGIRVCADDELISAEEKKVRSRNKKSAANFPRTHLTRWYPAASFILVHTYVTLERTTRTKVRHVRCFSLTHEFYFIGTPQYFYPFVSLHVLDDSVNFLYVVHLNPRMRILYAMTLPLHSKRQCKQSFLTDKKVRTSIPRLGKLLAKSKSSVRTVKYVVIEL
jgi:hypothetical protein